MHRPFALLALVGLPLTALAADEGAPEGLLGLRYVNTDSGLLVTGITVDMGALDAGLAPGMLLTKAGDTPLPAPEGQTRGLLVGTPGTTVSLTVTEPLGGPSRTVEVERRVPPISVLEKKVARPQVVTDFRMAVKKRSRRKAIKAAEAMIAADFGGMEPAAAVGAALKIAWRRSPKLARAIAEVLAPAAGGDERLLSRTAEVFIQTDGAADVVELLEQRAALLPPDVTLFDGTPGDIGGHRRERHMLADAHWKSGQRDEGIAVARELLRTWRIDELAGQVGLAVPPAPAPWRAKLPPVDDFEVPLLDGGTWRLSDAPDTVTVLNFWATWCGPCKEELPELVELHHKRSGEPLRLLAVSVDQGDDREPIRKMAEKLGVDFPVGHEPTLGARFNVGAIPALRVIGKDGAVHYTARGYSSSSMAKLSAALDRALGDEGAGGAALAWPEPVAAGSVQLDGFWAEAATRTGVAVSDNGVVVGIAGASPGGWSHEGELVQEPDLSAGSSAPGKRLAWLDGPVGVDPGWFILRAWDELGTSRWWHGLPSPATDLVATEGALWVAMEDHVAVLDSAGAVVARRDGGAQDLAVATDGGVWAVDGERRARLQVVNGELVERDVTLLAGAVRVSAAGDVASDEVVELVAGRFGPEGAHRVVASRSDGTVVALDGAGRPAWSVRFRTTPGLAAADVDGDGHDELFLAVPDYGLARVEVELP